MTKYLKDREYTCPVCGTSEDTETMDWDFEGEYLIYELTCQKCHTDWKEFYAVQYDGYEHEDKEYNAAGVEVI